MSIFIVLDQQLYIWRKMPFIRLIIPMMAGIVLQFYVDISTFIILTVAGFSIILLALFIISAFTIKYKIRWVQGIAVYLLFLCLGAFLVVAKDIKNNDQWVGNTQTDSATFLVTLQEPLIEKAKSYKAEVTIDAIQLLGSWKTVSGRLLLYISKDSLKPNLQYGSQLLFKKQLQEIKNSGNPGNFDYSQYNAFKDIYHQVFLKTDDYIIAATTNKNLFQEWLFNVRSKVIATLQQHIHEDRESGVAEALLIGYRDDLDKDLVQAYSNTGVVHIIAISGLHLGMIYGALVLLLQPFRKTKWVRIAKPMIILTVLWIFSLLAGGVPSILRSAVMFTFIVMGEAFDRKSSIYNTLASSAFVLLVINPYYLWDIGFQLSYIAVLSIVTFSAPVYNLIYLTNKALDFIWRLSSVTLSAQILTLPIIFYSFHQFPNYFLITNCIIVPLSSIALFAELGILIFSFFPALAALVGKCTEFFIWIMNEFIVVVDRFPFAVSDGIQNSIAETILLYIVIVGLSYFFMMKYKPALLISLIAISLFTAVSSIENYNRKKQSEIVVYNIPKLQGIDFIAGKQYAFLGDSILLEDGYARNFHLKPARTLYRTEESNYLEALYISKPFVQYFGKKIVLIDKPYSFKSPMKISVDMIVISHNPKVNIADLANTFDCAQYVFDGSNSMWKINRWKRACDSLHLRQYSTTDNGAYILKIN